MTQDERTWLGKRILIRWYATRWCNFRCHYCPQEHERKQIYRGSPGHWADNRGPLEWVEAFRHHFHDKEVAMCFTGGEPMLDRKVTEKLLRMLLEEPWLAQCKIDTNGSWNPRGWDVPKGKLSLMMSYHPTQTTLTQFLANLDGLCANGWPVVLVNWVMQTGHFQQLVTLDICLRERGIPLNLLPVDGQIDSYTPDEVEALRDWNLPEAWDVISGVPPIGKPCLHPAISYKIYQDGQAEVGCHEHLTGNLFGTLPQLFPSYVPCPRDQCLCLEKWTFLKELDGFNSEPLPINNYSKKLALL